MPINREREKKPVRKHVIFTSAAFALPAVLVASIVMLSVLIVSVRSTTSTRHAISTQFYDDLAREAAESGIARAKSCISQNGSVTWTEAQPLRPGTNCNGQAQPSFDNFVFESTRVRSTFVVMPYHALTSTDTLEIISPVGVEYLSLAAAGGGGGGTPPEPISAEGTVQLLRVSDGSVWREYTSYVVSIEKASAT